MRRPRFCPAPTQLTTPPPPQGPNLLRGLSRVHGLDGVPHASHDPRPDPERLDPNPPHQLQGGSALLNSFNHIAPLTRTTCAGLALRAVRDVFVRAVAVPSSALGRGQRRVDGLPLVGERTDGIVARWGHSGMHI